MLSFSADGLVTQINGNFLKDLGFDETEIIGKVKIENLLSAGGKIFFQTHLYPVIKMQKHIEEFFLFFLSKEKVEIPVLLNAVLIEKEHSFEVFCGGLKIPQRRDFEQQLQNAKTVAEDALHKNEELLSIRNELLAAQRQLELQLRDLSQKNTQQTELNKILSHDLQEPFRKISLFVERLGLRRTEFSDESLGILEKINVSVGNVRELLSGLERFNSLENKIPNRVAVDLSKLLETARKRSGLPAETELLVDIAEPRPLLFTDQNLLSSLLSELLRLSVKNKQNSLMPKVTILVDTISANAFIETKQKYLFEDYLRLQVSGDGFNLENNGDSAFELFRKSGKPIDASDIGMAYCQKIVQRLNGTIKISDEHDRPSIIILLPLKG